jgi:hypothetical protein
MAAATSTSTAAPPAAAAVRVVLEPDEPFGAGDPVPVLDAAPAAVLPPFAPVDALPVAAPPLFEAVPMADTTPDAVPLAPVLGDPVPSLSACEHAPTGRRLKRDLLVQRVVKIYHGSTYGPHCLRQM